MYILFEASAAMGDPVFDYTTEAEYCPAFRASLLSSGGTLHPPAFTLAATGATTPSNGLSRFDLVRAALVGCETSGDGLLDRWYRTDNDGRGINISVAAYNNTFGAPLNRTYINNLSKPRRSARKRLTGPGGVERAIYNLQPVGDAPLLGAFRSLLHEIDSELDNTNCYHCSNIAIIISTGSDTSHPTSQAGLAFNIHAGKPSETFYSPHSCFVPSVFHRYNGSGLREPVSPPPSGMCPVDALGLTPSVSDRRYLDAAAQYAFGTPESALLNTATGGITQADYEHDVLSQVNGRQRVRVFTVGVKERDDASRQMLVDMANAGGGEYTTVSNLVDLKDAMRDILRSLDSATSGSFAGSASLGSGISIRNNNYIYRASFRPTKTGYWKGTIEKHCLYEDPSDSSTFGTCYLQERIAFLAGTGQYLKNPDPEDIWTPVDRDFREQRFSASRFPGVETGTTSLALAPFAGSIVRPTSDTPASVNAATIPQEKQNYTGTAALMAHKTMAQRENAPLGYRRIFSWGLWHSPGGALEAKGYTLIQDFAAQDLGVSSLAEQARTVGYLYGFSPSGFRGFRTAASQNANTNIYGYRMPADPMWWNQGQTPEGGLVLLRYSKDCEEESDQCYLAAISNDGLIHIFDARTGEEIEAILPEPFKASTLTAHNTLRELRDQPAQDKVRRYYFDGKLRLAHQDRNANGIIDERESAVLIAGFGRGGFGYLLWDVSNRAGATLSSGLTGFSGPSVRQSRRNVQRAPSSEVAATRAPRPLLFDFHSSLIHLGETWARPTTARVTFANEREFETDYHNGYTYDAIVRKLGRTVAIFPSGHLRELDAPDAPMGPQRALERKLLPGQNTSTCDSLQGIPDFGIPGTLCKMPTPDVIASTIDPSFAFMPSDTCSICDESCPTPELCPRFILPTAASSAFILCGCSNTDGSCGTHRALAGSVLRLPCLESLAYDEVQDVSFVQADLAALYIESLRPLVRRSPVFRHQTGTLKSVSLKVSTEGLQPGDELRVYDGEGNLLHSVTTRVSDEWTQFFRADAFSIEYIGDGSVEDRASQSLDPSYVLHEVRYFLEEADTGVEYHPSIYLAELDPWRDTQELEYARATDLPQFPSQGEAVLAARFTNDDCDGKDVIAAGIGRFGIPGFEYRQEARCFDHNSPGLSDLSYMTCPISSEIAVLERQGVVEALYFGDECGQIFRIRRDHHLSSGYSAKLLFDANADLPSNRTSNQLRKIFTELQIVETRDCGGEERIGVFFGTGNVQRPLAAGNTTGTAPNYLDGRRDLIGMIWDLPNDTPAPTLSDLFNVRRTSAKDLYLTSGLDKGWILHLEDGEKMLRKPVVVDGVALYSTFLPSVFEGPPPPDGNPCEEGAGISFVYQLDMCNGDPVARQSILRLPQTPPLSTTQRRRKVVNANSNIGGEFEVLFTKEGKALVFAGDDDGSGEAVLQSAQSPLRLRYWRLD